MKRVFCIFAHPDDEAFGPGGTIAKLAQKYEVYLLCATKGQAGEDHARHVGGPLGKRRAQELVRSARILGVKKVIFLGFNDGTLSNNLYHKLAGKIESHLKRLRPEILVTYERGGISGHLDHVAVSLVTSYVFERSKNATTLLQSCRREEPGEKKWRYFVYVPPGYPRRAIDMAVDVRGVWETKVTAMLQHKSQIKDMKNAMKYFAQSPKEEYFLVTQKGRRRKKFTI